VLTGRDHAPLHHDQSRGFTLIELLVGLAVGAIVLTGVIYSWALAVRNNAYVLSVTALNNDMRTIMHMVTQDIRRAAQANFDSDTETIEIAPGGSCIAFNTYIARELTQPEALLDPTPSGYRLQGGRFEMWYSPPDVALVESFGSCAANHPNWHPIFENGDRGVTLTTFSVTTDRSRCLDLNDPTQEDAGRCPTGSLDKVELLLLDIALGGEINIGGQSHAFSFTDSVKIRNDRVINQESAP
jgi:prepilin-type N-terminal cleavage/methylation domain-containing protein